MAHHHLSSQAFLLSPRFQLVSFCIRFSNLLAHYSFFLKSAKRMHSALVYRIKYRLYHHMWGKYRLYHHMWGKYEESILQVYPSHKWFHLNTKLTLYTLIKMLTHKNNLFLNVFFRISTYIFKNIVNNELHESLKHDLEIKLSSGGRKKSS